MSILFFFYLSFSNSKKILKSNLIKLENSTENTFTFLSENQEFSSSNNKLFVLDMKIIEKSFLINTYNFLNLEKNNLLYLDLLYSDSFLFEFEKDQILQNHPLNKMIFHTDFVYAYQNVNFSDFKLKEEISIGYLNITEFMFGNMYINNTDKNDNFNIFKYSSFLSNIDKNYNISGTLSLSRESDQFEIFKKMKNENFDEKDFIIDIKYKKLVFGITDEYKQLNLSSIYSKNENIYKDNILKNENFTFCNYYDTDYLVLNKKRKFYNCFISYLYLGDRFIHENTNTSENSIDKNLSLDNNIIPIEIKKMAIFDSLSKYILFPIENFYYKKNHKKISSFNYLYFYQNLFANEYISEIKQNSNNTEFFCFINDNTLLEKNEDDGNSFHNLFLNKKTLICLSKHPKNYILENNSNFFKKQNFILNTISFELNLANLLDEIEYNAMLNIINNTKVEEVFPSLKNASDKNFSNTNDKNNFSINTGYYQHNYDLINFSKNFKFAFEYNIAFYNSTRIQNLISENKQHILLKDNFFQYETNPVILGTSFFMEFDQISFENSNKKIVFYGGNSKDLQSVLDDPSTIGMISNFIFSSLWVLILILIFLLVPYYFYRRRKRMLMEKLQYEIIYKKMEDITKECSK